MTALACGACGAPDLSPCYPRARDYISHDCFAVWRCAACGTGRTVPEPADLSPYYPTKYRQYNAAIAAILRRLYQLRVKSWVKHTPTPGSVFEMGCGNGLMLATLRDLGWQACGSERTEAAAHVARSQSDVRVVVGGPEDLPGTERFDLLLMIQVLEHLPNPSAAISAMAQRLQPAGRLVIGVPNFASWQSRFGGATWFHLDVPRHLHHFSLPGLQALLARHGLAIDRVSYISPEHDPYGWVQSILNRIDPVANRMTRLLMRIDPPGAANVAHLFAGCVLGVLAVPLSALTWWLRRGAVMEITCVIPTRVKDDSSRLG